MNLMLELVKLVTAILGLVKLVLEMIRSLRAERKGGSKPPGEGETDARGR